MFPKFKKGGLTWDEIGKLIIFLVIFIAVLIIIWIFKDKIFALSDKFKMIFSGGFR